MEGSVGSEIHDVRGLSGAERVGTVDPPEDIMLLSTSFGCTTAFFSRVPRSCCMMLLYWMLRTTNLARTSCQMIGWEMFARATVMSLRPLYSSSTFCFT
jgi:hypothetical protein